MLDGTFDLLISHSNIELLGHLHDIRKTDDLEVTQLPLRIHWQDVELEHAWYICGAHTAFATLPGNRWPTNDRPDTRLIGKCRPMDLSHLTTSRYPRYLFQSNGVLRFHRGYWHPNIICHVLSASLCGSKGHLP